VTPEIPQVTAAYRLFYLPSAMGSLPSIGIPLIVVVRVATD
jgi:hypothetical protein